MTLEAKVGLIVDRLLEKSEEGQIVWEASDANHVIYSLPDSSIEIGRQEGTGHDWYMISVYGADGIETVIVEDREIGREEELARLYEVARRQALGADEVVNSVLERLGRAS